MNSTQSGEARRNEVTAARKCIHAPIDFTTTVLSGLQLQGHFSRQRKAVSLPDAD